MTELELEIKDKNDQVIRAKATTDDKATASEPPVMSKISKGEKDFNWWVYNGLNYWANLGISLVLADLLTHGKGHKSLQYGIGKLAQGISKLGVPLETAYKQSRVALETLSLMTGGWLLLIPMKLAEDNKRPIVHWLNEHRYKLDQRAADGHQMNSDEIYIEKEQPKQSWGNVIKRRIYATIAIVSFGMIVDHTLADKTPQPDKLHPLNPYDPNTLFIREEGHRGGKQVATDFIANAVNKGTTAIGAGSLVKDKEHWSQRYLALAALDTVFTKAVAIIMHVTNGAGRGQAPKEIGDDAAPNVVPGSINRLETIPDAPAENLSDKSRAATAIITAEREAAKFAKKPDAKTADKEDCEPCKFADAIERKAPRSFAAQGGYTEAAQLIRQKAENSTMALES